jgi:hypothetical protein
MVLTPAGHQRLAFEYKARAALATTIEERDDLLQRAQEHMLLVDPDAHLIPSKR